MDIGICSMSVLGGPCKRENMSRVRTSLYIAELLFFVLISDWLGSMFNDDPRNGTPIILGRRNTTNSGNFSQ
jgi:hypothetical protein